MFDFYVWFLCFASSNSVYAIWPRSHNSSWTKMRTFRHTIITWSSQAGCWYYVFPLLFLPPSILTHILNWTCLCINTSPFYGSLPYPPPPQKKWGKIYTRYFDEYISSAPFPLCEVLWIFLLVSFLLSSFYFILSFNFYFLWAYFILSLSLHSVWFLIILTVNFYFSPTSHIS